MTDYLTNPAALGTELPFGVGDESPRASFTLRVNGLERPVTNAWIGESLLYVLRERLGLAGAKGGCEQGECGACSVQLDGQLTAACLVPAALAADSEIRTVEGLAADGTASDVQRALAESGAVQCGYCVPGLAMAVHDLLERNHQPTDLQAREALCGNLCRCTGYRGALAAVQAVAAARAAEPAEDEDGTEGAEGGEPDEAAALADGTGPGEGRDEPPVYVTPSGAAQGEQEPEQSGAPDPLFGPLDGLTGGDADPSAAPHDYGRATAGTTASAPQTYGQQGDGSFGTGQFATGQFATGRFETGQFETGQFDAGQFATGRLDNGEFGTGQFGTGHFGTGPFAADGFGTGQFATGPFDTSEFETTQFAAVPSEHEPQPGYPQDAAGYAGYQQTDYAQPQADYPGGEPEAGVYVLPHQQQHEHLQQSQHSSAPEAGA